MPAVFRFALNFLLLSLTGFGAGIPSALGQAISADDQAFFENRIRPVLVQHCFQCHAPGAEELGGKLLLDSRQGLRRGGESGPAVEPGKPESSLLIQALRYDGLQMPPGERLPDQVVNDFVEWVRRGAPDPRLATAASSESNATTAGLWSLQPVADPPLPEVRDSAWPRDALDRFVLARIEAAGRQPAGDAPARTLVRRLYFDLTGLPPGWDDVQRFEAAYGQDQQSAVERLVDRLLASPQFAERWGRHWLDVARFGESNGNDGLGRNPTFPHAWRYRDYVIAAVQEDLPYDRFLTEQLAGDLLPYDSPQQRDRQLIATGLLALTAKPAKAMNNNFDMDVVADQIDVVGRGIMALSITCARCHDHKFDPVSTRDYYALAGIFTSTETLWGLAANEGLTAPKTDLHVLQAAPRVPPPDDFVETVLVLESNTGQPKPVPKPPWPAGTPLAMGVKDRPQPADCKINIKGEANKLGEAVPRGFLTACQTVLPGSIAVDSSQSGRLQLAQWLTQDNHPLTARVMANRVWLHLFGEGIVRTPDDFGVYGERPTHPALLDHLAQRFVAGGWSVKRLIRAIVLSRTYQVDSAAAGELLRADAQNLLLARHNRRRLDAESLRDAMLRASGQLDLRPGEGSLIRHRDILVNLAGNLHQPSRQRSVYLCYLRSSPPPELAAFDLPEFTSVTGRRDLSTVPGQALHLYNSPFVREQADCLAMLVQEASADSYKRVELAFRQVLGRDPQPGELEQTVEFVRLTAEDLASEDQVWAALCQALLITSEFRYVD